MVPDFPVPSRRFETLRIARGLRGLIRSLRSPDCHLNKWTMNCTEKLDKWLVNGWSMVCLVETLKVGGKQLANGWRAFEMIGQVGKWLGSVSITWHFGQTKTLRFIRTQVQIMSIRVNSIPGSIMIHPSAFLGLFSPANPEIVGRIHNL